MIHTYTYKHLTWVDLESPSADEIKNVIGQYALHPEVAEELLSPSIKPKIEVYQNYFFIVLNFPVIKHSHTGVAKSQEIDFIVGKDVIITTRYDTIDPLHRFSRIFEANALTEKGGTGGKSDMAKNMDSDIGAHAGNVFYYMLIQLYRALMDETDAVRDRLDLIEIGIFEGEERQMLLELSRASRDIIDFRQALAHHKDILLTMGEHSHSKELFGKEYGAHLATLISEYEKITLAVETLRDIQTELRETNNSLLTAKQNDIVQIFTILAFLTFPLALIVDVLTINLPDNPLLGLPHLFWTIVGIVVVSTGAMCIYFKKKKWL